MNKKMATTQDGRITQLEHDVKALQKAVAKLISNGELVSKGLATLIERGEKEKDGKEV